MMGRILKSLVRKLVFLLSFIFVGMYVFHFILATSRKGYIAEQYAFFFTAIGLTATLAGLSLTLSNCSEQPFKKRLFYKIGVKFTLSFSIFIFAILCKYIIDIFRSTDPARGGNPALVGKSDVIVLGILSIPALFGGAILFSSGIIYTVKGIYELVKILLQDINK